MLFNPIYLSLIFCIFNISSALPLEGAPKLHALAQRAKSYSIVNVDGGSTSAPQPTTVIVERTTAETVKVTASAPAVTSILTITVNDTTLAPAPTSPSPSSTTSAAHTPVPTLRSTSQPPLPSTSEKPTKYYDDGQWHTRYAIKSSAATAVVTPSPAVSDLPLSTLEVSSI
ncbi:hypothetical protein K504DRAFT_464159 [Pleomassaria siparia CBS 279.74]|uniref:Uncharacterized protein n=1 Tax=Pleomassaria siparia CBS 279.74 TaxID=1314801 RepID=A0A6G1KI45_9PLEO|nr:hypothetical protein K504DRAFT_464159 [Pleomassaria siparia CBS 279.74]